MAEHTEAPANQVDDTALQAMRKRWLTIVAGASAAAVIAYGVYWVPALRCVQSTDDAYVRGNIARITLQIAGSVASNAPNGIGSYHSASMRSKQ
jgi:multidrug resistance efflux pump